MLCLRLFFWFPYAGENRRLFFGPRSAETFSEKHPDQNRTFNKNRRSYLWITKHCIRAS